jgi:hypothetical protein
MVPGYSCVREAGGTRPSPPRWAARKVERAGASRLPLRPLYGASPALPTTTAEHIVQGPSRKPAGISWMISASVTRPNALAART